MKHRVCVCSFTKDNTVTREALTATAVLTNQHSQHHIGQDDACACVFVMMGNKRAELGLGQEDQLQLCIVYG